MKLLIDIPNSLYANLKTIKPDSAAGRRILNQVKVGNPIKDDNLITNIEKQVELEGDGYWDGQLVYDSGKCPNCGWTFEYTDKDWEEPYCCHCGQKLHWFIDENEEREE